jgi:hypothetical protein
MIHSRPGFASRSSDDLPAKLNQDMIPALHRKSKDHPAPPPLKEDLQASADAAWAKIQAERALQDAQAAAERLRLGPELLLNPTPSATPQILEPGA